MKKNNPDLQILRKKIDKIDWEIAKLIAKRMKFSPKIAQAKIQQGLPLFQRSRLQDLLKVRSIWSKKFNLKRNFLLKIFKLIHDESLENQKKTTLILKKKR